MQGHPTRRTRFRRFHLEQTYVGLPLHNRQGELLDWALVEWLDLPLLGPGRWSLDSNGYAFRCRKHVDGPKLEKLHRVLLGLEYGDPRQGDHINGDPLDNRRANLRIVSAAENAQNVRATSGGSSRFRGVSWKESHRKWVAKVGEVHVGLFTDEVEAARAAEAYRGEHLPFSMPDPELLVLR